MLQGSVLGALQGPQEPAVTLQTAPLLEIPAVMFLSPPYPLSSVTLKSNEQQISRIMNRLELPSFPISCICVLSWKVAYALHMPCRPWSIQTMRGSSPCRTNILWQLSSGEPCSVFSSFTIILGHFCNGRQVEMQCRKTTVLILYALDANT